MTSGTMKDAQWTVAKAPWNAEGIGNHRAVIDVPRPAEFCSVSIPWRRRDHYPENMCVRVFGPDGNEVFNVAPLSVTCEVGRYAFHARQPGEYLLYYMPFKLTGNAYCPHTEYYAADYSRTDAKWLSANAAAIESAKAAHAFGSAEAKVLRIEARSEFDSFEPMEVVATSDEAAALVAANRGRTLLVFPEDRLHPVRMTDALPLRWIKQGPSDSFKGSAQPNEYYPFQLAVYAVEPIDALAVRASDLRGEGGKIIPASAVTCFNLQGVDWLGRPFTKNVPVPAGNVQALWFGVDVPADAKGTYRGTITILPDGPQPVTVNVTLEVAGEVLRDRGDSELWRHSRIRWLNSTIGIDDEPTAPYLPMEVEGTTVTCLGRRVRFGPGGLPQSIQSLFAPTGEKLVDAPTEILHRPMELVAKIGGKSVPWQDSDPTIERLGGGHVRVRARRQAGALTLDCRAEMESDGHIDYYLTIEASQDVAVDDMRLLVPLRREIATYMMGFGCKGGYRPNEWKYRWDVNFSNNMVWIGEAHAGLQCKLKHVEDAWALLNFRDAYGLPQNWANQGQGGCDITEESGDCVLLDAFTGPRTIRAGQPLVLRAALLITPTKPLDTDAHWQQRYYHGCDMNKVFSYAADAQAGGATVMNLHHGNVLLPHINYPFLYVDKLKRYVQDGHDRGLKVKFYYTIRELTNFTAEFWMLRSLGDEIFMRGKGGFLLADHFAKEKTDVQKTHGHAWLCEHLVEGYAPAWHQPLEEGKYDAAIGQQGLSRWHNYYLEGLRWLVEEVGIDGIYLDGIGYDREIMKRVRKVLDRARPGCLVDFHSGNNFSFWTGMNNSANQYMEHFPFQDSLWFGEAYNYDESPEYWLTEMSGIPFGLMNDMLEGGGNPWRGMTMGMSIRMGYINGTPVPMWNFWRDFGMVGSRMIGFWAASCPVKVDHPDLRATAYVRPGRTLVSLASWAKEEAACRLQIDYAAMGLDSAKVKITAPTIEGFQDKRTFCVNESIPVAPGKGWLLVVE